MVNVIKRCVWKIEYQVEQQRLVAGSDMLYDKAEKLEGKLLCHTEKQ